MPEQHAEPGQLNLTGILDGGFKFEPADDRAELALQLMALGMCQILDEQEAQNYVELGVWSPKLRKRFIMTIQRDHRPTPAELRNKAEARATEAERRLAQIADEAAEIMAWHADGGPTRDYGGEKGDMQHHCVSCGTPDEYPESWPCAEYEKAAVIKELATLKEEHNDK